MLGMYLSGANLDSEHSEEDIDFTEMLFCHSPEW